MHVYLIIDLIFFAKKGIVERKDGETPMLWMLLLWCYSPLLFEFPQFLFAMGIK